MAPELGEIRLIEQLAAGDEPSREGAWWIMLQTAESVCNCASLRDPVNNAFLSEFWTDATKHVTPLIESKAERPLPYDDLMQMVSYCGDQLQMGDNNEHIIEERLLLKANEKEFSFPLVRQDISRKSTMIDAYITDKSFPLDHDVEVSLSVRYKYGYFKDVLYYCAVNGIFVSSERKFSDRKQRFLSAGHYCSCKAI